MSHSSFNFAGNWRYRVELKGVPLLKRPVAALGKVLNEATAVHLDDNQIAVFKMRGAVQTGKWWLEDGNFHISTGYGTPQTGVPQPDGNTILMDCQQGEFGQELSNSRIFLTRVP